MRHRPASPLSRGAPTPGAPVGRVAAAVAVLLLLAGCRAEAPPGTVVVNMYDNAYSPPRVRIPEGGRVVFRNLGRNQHHAVALDEGWSTESSFGSLVMELGDEAEVVFERRGVYPFYCTFHGSPLGDRGMVGAVLVGDVEEPAAAARPAPVAAASGRVVRVPQEHARIQQAVDAASPGDLVLIDRGVYREEVRVTTPSLVVRGVDRNEVVLDGGLLFGNGVLVLADGVAVENLTVRNYLLNGVYWTGVTGYRGSYLTAYNNGDYGLYAFDSTDGVMEDSYASGHPDAGFYVGQCHPCRAVLRRLLAENNGLGYSGTNAGGELYLIDSVWRANQAGIVPNTLDSELMPPERETTIAGNLIVDNNNRRAPGKPLGYPALGTGILVAGGQRNLILRNRVVGHDGHGILILPNHDRRFWPATGNRVAGNAVSGSGRADLAVGWPGTAGNCFAGNRAAGTAPPGLERLRGCDGLRLPLGWDAVPALTALLRQRRAARGEFPRGDFRRQPPPPPQEPMPGGAGAPVLPAAAPFEPARPVLAELGLPAAPAALSATPSPAGDRWLAFLPLLLWVAWAGAALADLAGRRPPPGARAVWAVLAVALPWLGALAYLAAGRPRMGVGRRLALVAGGLAVWLAGVAVAAWAAA